MSAPPRAFLSEIFSSVQGEGPFLGCRQIFLRFCGCNLSCAYCDTPNSPAEFCQVEQTPGRRDFLKFKNPLTMEQIVGIINGFSLPAHHSVSLTGGEPLLWSRFLVKLIPLIKNTRQGVLLETNGTLHRQLFDIIDLIDIISMDLKLFSTSKIIDLWIEHKKFLAMARYKNLYVKVVVNEQTTLEEIDTAAKTIGEFGKHVLIIQPETLPGSDKPVNPRHLLKLQDRALGLLDDVRIIPQTHKYMGQL